MIMCYMIYKFESNDWEKDRLILSMYVRTYVRSRNSNNLIAGHVGLVDLCQLCAKLMIGEFVSSTCMDCLAVIKCK